MWAVKGIFPDIGKPWQASLFVGQCINRASEFADDLYPLGIL